MAGWEEENKLAQVAQKIDPKGRLLRAWRLEGGMSAQMTALEVALAGGETKKLIVRRPGEMAVRRNPQAAAEEFRVLQIVRSAGVSAQAPCLLDESGEIFPQPYLVIEYLEGRPEFAPADVHSYVVEAAAQLAAIHSIDSSKADLAFLPKQADRFADVFKERPLKPDDSLEETRIREALEAVWPLPELNAPVLLHGDFWPGNLLWRGDRLAAVIDWEDAEVGEPLMDLAISRLDTLWIFGVDAMNAFTQHYRSMTATDFTNLPYWDLCAALRPASRIAEWAEGWPELGRKDITERTMREGHSRFVTQAFERLAAR